MIQTDSRHRRCAIAVMAKAPRAGRVKTRLCPPLAPGEAMAMSAAFLRDITENIREAARDVAVDGVIAYAPDGTAGLFEGLLADGTALLLADGETALAREVPARVRGFGRSLLHAIDGLFAQGYAAAIVLNSDSPTLPTEMLRQAARALLEGEEDRAVLGPAEDGGYYLLGMRRPHAALFADIAWSTETVAADTRARARELGLPMVELIPWYDVDDRAALLRLLEEQDRPAGHMPFAAPATMACVARLDLRRRLPAVPHGR